MRIRRVQSQDRELNQLQYNVAQVVEPLTQQPLAYGNLLQSVSLKSGSNTINHKLGKPLTGWVMTRVRSSATFYDSQDANKTPETTLILNSSAAVVVDIFVF